MVMTFRSVACYLHTRHAWPCDIWTDQNDGQADYFPIYLTVASIVVCDTASLQLSQHCHPSSAAVAVINLIIRFIAFECF